MNYLSSSKNMPFWDHLEELRWCLIKSIFTIIIFTIYSYLNWEYFLDILLKPSENLNVKLNFQVLKITSIFIIKISCSILIGLIFSVPVILYQIWRFVNPALNEKFRFNIYFLTTISMLFFVIGLCFGFSILIPFSLDFFSSMIDSSSFVKYNITLDNYLYYVIWLSLLCGMIFQLPVISIYFSKIGLFTPAFLRHYRKHSYLFFLILGAILTPPDPLSQIAIGIPLIILYEFSILISLFYNKNHG